MDAWLPLKYELAFCGLCLAKGGIVEAGFSNLLWVGALFEKVLLQVPQHGLNCLLALQRGTSASTRKCLSWETNPPWSTQMAGRGADLICKNICIPSINAQVGHFQEYEK